MFKVKRNKITKQNGFTLVELLVVISIIAMLLAILMPAMSKAKKQAKTIICGTRQKQLGLGLMAYTNSYDGWIMPAALQYEKDGVTQVKNYGTPQMDPNAQFWYLNLINSKYLSDRDVFFCADAWPGNYKEHQAEFKAGRAGNFNKSEAFISGMRDWSYPTGVTCYRSPKLLTKIPRPSEFFLVADSISKDYPKKTPAYHFPAQFHRIMVAERAIATGPYNIGVNARHRNRVNTLFADGHVERQRMKYFLEMYYPKNWQAPYSKPFASTATTGYRVYDELSNEWQFQGIGRYYNPTTKRYSEDP